MNRAILTAALLTATSAYAGGICVSARGDSREADAIANVMCTSDEGFASGYEVKLNDYDAAVVRVLLLPPALKAVSTDATAAKIAEILGGALARRWPVVYVAFVPVRVGGDAPPFRFVTLRAGQKALVTR